MALVSSSIPNMVNGVSQQPYTLRLSSQAEVQENGLSTVSEGLKKRPPTKFIKKIGAPVPTTSFVHTINRDSEEQYIVVVTPGDLKVFDLEGNEKVVHFPQGKSYLDCPDPADCFRAMTVADYTFFLNTSVTVKPKPEVSPSRPYEALVVVKQGIYGKAYNIIIDHTLVAEYITPDGGQPGHSNHIVVDHIARSLYSDLIANGVEAHISGATIYITKPTDFVVTTNDGFNGAAMAVYKSYAQRFSDLPPNAVIDGVKMEIKGDVETTEHGYWIEYVHDGTTGYWKETIAPNTPLGFDPNTMPMALIRQANGEFSFETIDWSERVVGDEDTAPEPTFVGRKINDVFFYRNRLGILADEAIIFSEAGEFFNFFPTTVAQLLDSDPIDYSVSHTKVSLLNYAVPFNKELMLFSTQTQFTVESGDLLTSKTMVVKTATEFECSPKVRPVGVGNNIYFATPKGQYEGIREYYISDMTETEDAAEITSHVPRYIPKGAYKIAAALNEDLLCVLSSSERNAVYVYKFFWSGNEKLQSSWSRWVFPKTDQVLNADFIESTLYLVTNRPDGLYLESLDVASGEKEVEEPYYVHLDRKLTIEAGQGVFDGERTTLPIPWPAVDGEYTAVVAEGQPEAAGTLLEVEVDENGASSVKGDFSDCELIVGRRYKFRYELSPLMIRTAVGQGQQADTVGRLQIRKVAVNYSDTGYFQVRVTPQGRDTYVYTYSGKTLGLPSATLGTLTLADGQFSFPVLSRNTAVDIEIVSDSPLPCSFLSADWEGFYVRRSQRV